MQRDLKSAEHTYVVTVKREPRMSRILQNLLDLLSLEEIEQGIYRGQSQDLGFPQVFGGQVMGQALSAAKYTLPEGRYVNSLHSYFLRPGDATKPIVYDVENIRDGRSFSTRRVVPFNMVNRFSMTASFQGDEPGLSHQSPMPEVPEPESLKSLAFLSRACRSYSEKLRLKFTQEMPLDMRPVNQNPFKPNKQEPVRHVWFKANGDMPNDRRIHNYLLAYASDFEFLPTAPCLRFVFYAAKYAGRDHRLCNVVSPFRLDDWILYSVDSQCFKWPRLSTWSVL